MSMSHDMIHNDDDDDDDDDDDGMDQVVFLPTCSLS